MECTDNEKSLSKAAVIAIRPQIACDSHARTCQGDRLHGRGRPADFDQIYRTYRRRVYALCLRMAGNWADAEDLTQEAFLQLYRKIDTFRGESAFTTWLHRLVVNVVLRQRRKKSLPEQSLDSAYSSGGGDSYPQESLGALDATLTSAIDRLTLEVAVAGLPQGFRAVLVLHDVEGYEHNEIARLLGVSDGTSKSQLHKARLRLRDLLKRGQAGKLRAGVRSHRTVRGETKASRRRVMEDLRFSSESGCSLRKGS